MVGSVQKIIVTVTGGKDKKETDLKETAQRDLRQSHLSESTPLVVFLSIIDQNQNFIECDTERQNKPELLNLKQSHFLFPNFNFLVFIDFDPFFLCCPNSGLKSSESSKLCNTAKASSFSLFDFCPSQNLLSRVLR